MLTNYEYDLNGNPNILKGQVLGDHRTPFSETMDLQIDGERLLFADPPENGEPTGHGIRVLTSTYQGHVFLVTPIEDRNPLENLPLGVVPSMSPEEALRMLHQEWQEQIHRKDFIGARCRIQPKAITPVLFSEDGVAHHGSLLTFDHIRHSPSPSNAMNLAQAA